MNSERGAASTTPRRRRAVVPGRVLPRATAAQPRRAPRAPPPPAWHRHPPPHPLLSLPGLRGVLARRRAARAGHARRRPAHPGRLRRRASPPARGAFDLVYVDPPFNTGAGRRRHVRCRSRRDPEGDRAGFGGRRYRDGGRAGACLRRRLRRLPRLPDAAPAEARRVLADHGTLYVHLDPRESHYVKVPLDELFGRDCFLNEIVWAYDYGGRPRAAGPPSTTRSSSTSRTPPATTSTTPRSTASPTWRPGS